MDEKEKLLILNIMSDEQLRETLLAGIDGYALLAQQLPLIALQFKLQQKLNNLSGECVGCMKCCCTVCHVDVTLLDIERLAEHFKITKEAFIAQYCTAHPKFPDHLYRFKQVPCPFLKDNSCSVYPARPTVCLLWPFLHTTTQDQATKNFEKTGRLAVVVPLGCRAASKAIKAALKENCDMKIIIERYY